MQAFKITSKGQVTIPNDIREAHGFLPNTEVCFVEDKNGRVYLKKIEPKKNSRGQNIVAKLRGTATVNMTTDEIMALTREK